jgi:hypothetical protein
MNQLIKEYSNQARIYANQCISESPVGYGKTASEFRRIYEAKFAELIIQKCMSIVAMYGVQNYENDDICWTCEGIIDEIKANFRS